MLTIIVSILNVINAQDWHQFLGPDRNSISPQKGLFRTWSENGPELLWSVELGTGFGGPVVKNGKIFLLDRDDEVGDMMRCFHLQTGEEVWKFSYEAPGAVPYPGSRSVPIVDDSNVYSVGPNGDLYCINIQTGKPVWNKNIWSDFGATRLPVWGVSQSPSIYGDLIFTATGSPTLQIVGLAAFNKKTGNIVWHIPEIGNETYSSPKLVKIHGEDQITFVTSQTNTYMYKDVPVTKGKVSGFDPLTGEILWQYANWDCVISIPCPVDAGNNKLLITGGYDQGTTMLQINKKADGTFEAVEIFKNSEFEDQTKPPLLYNGYFYGMFRTNTKREGLVCMNMEGKMMWKTGVRPNIDRGSMILADGLILASDGTRMLYLIEPSPEGFKPISSVELLSNGLNWSPMALADGNLLIRDQNRMFCLKVAQ